MTLTDKYKKTSGYDVGKHNIDNTDYYSEDYVKWLESSVNSLAKRRTEAQLFIGKVSEIIGADKTIELLKESKL